MHTTTKLIETTSFHFTSKVLVRELNLDCTTLHALDTKRLKINHERIVQPSQRPQQGAIFKVEVTRQDAYKS